MSETADERTDVSGRTWYTTYISLMLLLYRDNRRIVQLDDALAEACAIHNNERHPLLSDELLQIKRPLERESRNEMPSPPEAEPADTIDAVGSLWVQKACEPRLVISHFHL